ncbi:MAG: hypothetical protein K0R68_588 [Mycobacterium sp.]|nr:hypothetical protein [Mycobacterium sp.]
MTLTAPVFESVVGAGAMINWISVERAHVPVYEDWYNFQHLPERVSTPGFLRARRFIAAEHREGAERTDYLTLYETTDVDVLASPEYLRRLDNPTDLTLEVVPLFAEFRRAACHITVARGDGSSGRVLVVEVESETDAAALRTVLADTVFPGLIAEHRLVAASLYEPDAAVSDAKNTTAEGRSTAQQQAGASVIVAELHSGTEAGHLVSDIAEGAVQAGARWHQLRAARTFDLIYELRSATPSPSPISQEASCG